MCNEDGVLIVFQRNPTDASINLGKISTKISDICGLHHVFINFFVENPLCPRHVGINLFIKLLSRRRGPLLSSSKSPPAPSSVEPPSSLTPSVPVSEAPVSKSPIAILQVAAPPSVVEP